MSLAGAIQPGAVQGVWAMPAGASQGGFDCGFGRNIWNYSRPDPAVLYDNSGVLVDRCP